MTPTCKGPSSMPRARPITIETSAPAGVQSPARRRAMWRFAVVPFAVVAMAGVLSGCDGSTVTTVVAEVHTVNVDPPSVSIHEQRSIPLRAIPRDASGNDLSGRQVTWSSSNPSAVAVNNHGIATGVAVGTAIITAVVDEHAGTATVTVTRAPLGVGFGDGQFALIPAGSFQMGSTNGFSSEQPVHIVTITRPFYIQKTEVTQGQWREIMGSNPSHFSSCGDNCPVDQASWDAIQEFLRRLNAEFPGRNYRLPTEAEWEYAARAGTTGDYGGTGNLDGMGWYGDNSAVDGVPQTHPVARKQPNAFGLYDMHGNVWEWVHDWEGPYTADAKTDPTGPTTGRLRVLRGGSYIDSAIHARSANRSRQGSTVRSRNYGFRLARTP